MGTKKSTEQEVMNMTLGSVDQSAAEIAVIDDGIESYNGTEPYIFISYSHRDEDKVRKILKELSLKNYRFWFDQGLNPGDEFAKVLYDKIQNCCAIMVFLSKSVFDSNYCKFELFTGHVLGKKICPFILSDKGYTIPSEFQPIINNTHQISLGDTKNTDVNSYINKLPIEAKDAMVLSEDKKVITEGEQFSKRAVIPVTVEKIGEKAYKNRTELREVEIGSGAEIIGEEAFRNCSKISELEIPPQIKMIGDSSFRDCVGLKKLVIKNHPEKRIIEIGERAFENCTSLEEISLPNDLKELYSGCFNSCKALKQIAIPKEVTSIGENAFGECISLEKIVIPKNVTKIDDLAFAGCSKLKVVSLNDGLLKIGKNTFKDCTSLEEITIPATVTKMGTSPFRGCSNLRRIIVERSKYFKHEDGVLFNKSKSQLICCPANRNGDSIEADILQDDSSRTHYSIPDSVIEIGEWAFSDCEFLETVSIPDSVTDIGEGAFFKCKGLREIVIPDSVVRIDDIVFRGCENLVSVTIPESVVEIGWGIFSGCSEELKVKCKRNSKIYKYCQEKQIECITDFDSEEE